MDGLEIFKYLPGSKKSLHTNCKECGCPTCMAFAIKLAERQTSFDRCRYMETELKELFAKDIKSPQKIINIDGLKIGGEKVLYRHEYKFINKIVFAVVLDYKSNDFEKKLEQIRNFNVNLINENSRIDLIILRNADKYKVKNLCDEIIYIKEKDFSKLALTKIEDKNFAQTSEQLINIRKKLIIDKNEKLSNPVYVYLRHTEDLNLLCAKAAYYICKYANMLVFEDFDEKMFSALMTLRKDIFTDPQKPLQVESRIYEYNNPDENSLVFLTTDYALTFHTVSNELKHLNVPSYLIVAQTGGMSASAANSSNKFSASGVKKLLKKYDFENKIKTRKIIIPGLLASAKADLEKELSNFEIIIGTVEASSIAEFIKQYQ